METIGNRIKTKRVKKGLTQEQLGKLVGVGKSSVSQWENGITKNLIGHNLYKVAIALCMDESELLTGKPSTHKSDNVTEQNDLIKIQEKSLTMTVLMTPDMANFSGKVHGGIILKLLDQVAYACAAKYSKNYVVTAALDNVFFKQAINVGELVTFYAHINYVGKASMEVGIKVVAENLRTDEKRHTTSCYFTMVAVDEDGNSVEVPRLEVNTDVEKKLYEAAIMRKQMRQEILEKNRALHVDLPETGL